jgi:hypothetical protein
MPAIPMPMISKVVAQRGAIEVMDMMSSYGCPLDESLTSADMTREF